MSVAVGPFFDGLAELFLLPPDELLPLASLPLPDLFEVAQLLHLLLSLLLLLVCEAPLPLLLLDFNVLRPVPVLLPLKPLEIERASVQIVLRHPSQVGGIVYHIVPVDLLLVARHVQEIGHVGLWEGILVLVQLFLESFQSRLGHR